TPIDRARAIARAASGFLYYVAVTGVTGARAAIADDLEVRVREMRAVTDLPIGVGFGISTPAQAAEVARFADAVIVGSALSMIIEGGGASREINCAVGDLVGAMKQAMRDERWRTRAAAGGTGGG